MRRLLVLVLPFLLGCAAFRSKDPDAIGNAERETAARHIELAAAEFEAGRPEDALERLIAVHVIRGLEPEDRTRCDALLEQTADVVLGRRSTEPFDSGDLYDIYKLDLPTRLRARAGVLAARRMLEEGSRIRAFRMIQKVETALPNHPERGLAGEVLARAGLSLAADDGRYALLFRYRSKGVSALEYLVLTYPFDRNCPEAYHVLARIYERRSQLSTAIARYEDLVIYHPSSPWAIEAEAMVPRLRMRSLDRDDYDRGEVVLARQELEAWLRRHAGHPLEPEVRTDLRLAQDRLSNNDLILARYYARIGNPFGARLHAGRALEEASAAGSEAAIQDASALLASLPEEGAGGQRRPREWAEADDEAPSPVED